ncbi:hypothetical protein MBLNU457_5041t1 [Dothideomycetes sp. NU457]
MLGISKTEVVNVPPGHPGQPYVMSSMNGEIIYIPCSKSATRLLVTGKETENAFAVVGSGGSQGDPIGFHFHREAHDVFLCLKGSVNVWAGKKCRTMTPGDFASVPPDVVHQYQIVGDHAEFVGLIVPGGWEEFFRFIGEPYSGPMWPMEDDRNPFEVLIPKLKAATEKFDMVPVMDQASFPPSEWQADENRLLGAPEEYFLKNGTGPKYLVSGSFVRPLATTAESNGRFTIASIEGSALHKGLFGDQTIRFSKVHHCFQVVEGAIDIKIGDDGTSRLNAGELCYIPAGVSFKFDYTSRFAKAYVFSNGGGLIETLIKLGRSYDG